MKHAAATNIAAVVLIIAARPFFSRIELTAKRTKNRNSIPERAK
jgi:hypothetical protein